MITEEVKIVTATSAGALTSTINTLINQGWKRKGSHSVVVTHEQKRYAGSQHMDTIYKTEYSITLVREIDSEMEQYKPNQNE